jgi:lipocalin
MIRPSSVAVLALAVGVAPLTVLAQTSAPAAAPYTQEQLFEQFRGMWENTDRISIEKFETVTEPLTAEYQAKRDLQIRLRAHDAERQF